MASMTEARKREDVQIGRALRLDRGGALALLRDLARDRAVLADLRRLWAKETAATTLCFATDDQVLAQLSERVASGSLVIARVRAPLPKAPPPGSGGADGAAEAAQEEQGQAKEKPALMNPRWSVDRVEVGGELDAAFTYAGCDPGQAVTIKVYEVNASGTKKQVDKVEVSVPAKGGDHKAKWKRDPDKAAAFLKEDEAEGDTGPLEYRFTVEADGVGATGLSGPLWLTNTVNVNLQDDKKKALETPRIVVLRDFERAQRVKSKDGKAEFKKVLVGPVEVRLASPTFTDIGWSAPKVPVGEAVDAVFKYDDAIQGMKVSVFVHEHDADGTKTEVHRVEDIELEAEKGEVRVPFTRTAEQPAAHLAEDQRDGETDPIEYRYIVVAEDRTESAVSDKLWLSNTVEVNLKNTEGQALEAPRVVVLLDATGEEQRVPSDKGVATFKDVVLGPIDVRLANPHFAELGWSDPRVSAGQRVEAVFKYEDAMAGMKVKVVIHETHAGGAPVKVESLDVKLTAASGEARAPFQTDADGAPGLEYWYLVVQEGGAASPPSSSVVLK